MRSRGEVTIEPWKTVAQFASPGSWSWVRWCWPTRSVSTIVMGMLPLPPELDAAFAGRYTLQGVLGTGATSTVYRARDEKHDRDVAIKVLRTELVASVTRQRFTRETSIIAKLQHPHILALIDTGQVAEIYYFVMPLVDGVTLLDRLSEGEPLGMGEVTRVLADVADALAYAHKHGVVHRDLKPSNVLIAGRHALLMDFGVAKVLLDGHESDLTVGIALGTPIYMSPEQAMALPTVDHRADIYAFGVLGYELLAGRPPFAGGSSHEILSAHVSMTPEDLGVLRPDVPEPLREMIMRCLEKDPGERWPNAEALVARLDAIVTPSGGATPHAGPAQRKPARGWRRPGVLIPTIALALSAAVFLVRRPNPPSITVQRQQVTFAGNVIESAISADGEWLAYVTSDSAGQALFVRDLSSMTALELDRGEEVAGLIWSSDGSEIAYHVGGVEPVIRALPRLGGSGRVLGRGHWLPSPDLNRLVTFNQGEPYVTIANRIQGDTVQITRPTWVRWTNGVAWSPDSRHVAVEVAQPTDAAYGIFVTTDMPGERDFVEVVRDSVAVSDPSFSRDGRFIYYIRQPNGELPDLMRIAVNLNGRPVRAPRLVLQAFDYDARPGFYRPGFLNRLTHASDGQITYVRTDGESNVWILDAEDGSVNPTSRRITTGSAVHTDVSFSPDGEHLALVRTTRIAMTVGIMPANGGAIEPLAATEVQGEVAWSPSGKQLAFVRGPRDDLHIAVHDVESGATRVVTEYTVGADLSWAGSRIVVQGIGNRRLVLIDPESGKEETLVSDSVGFNFRPRASLDGRRLVFYRNWRGRGLWLQELSTGEPAYQVLSEDIFPLRFDETGEFLYVTDGLLRDDGARRVLKLEVATGELQTIMTLPAGLVAQDVTPNGRQVVATQIQWRGDVWRLIPSGR